MFSRDAEFTSRWISFEISRATSSSANSISQRSRIVRICGHAAASPSRMYRATRASSKLEMNSMRSVWSQCGEIVTVPS